MELRQRVIQLAEAYRRQHTPLTLERLAGGIGASYQIANIMSDGMLEFERKKILLADGQSPKRQRFTMAHEVMHYLIRADDEALSELHEHFDGEDLERELESLCNLGAAEMLLPGQAVEAGLTKRGQSPRLVAELAEQHQVSEEVVAIALANRGPRPSLVLFAGGKPVKVYFSSKHPDFRVPLLPRDMVIAKEHPLSDALITGLAFKGQAPLPGLSKLYALEAYPKAGRVYGVYKEIVN
jgi:Zn-dependent peptidase ImmA (M78 family)